MVVVLFFLKSMIISLHFFLFNCIFSCLAKRATLLTFSCVFPIKVPEVWPDVSITSDKVVSSINITVSPSSTSSSLVVSAEFQLVLEGSWLIFIIKAISPSLLYPGECPHWFPFVHILHHEMWSSVIVLGNTMQTIQSNPVVHQCR